MDKIKENWAILLVSFAFTLASFFVTRAVNANDSEKISLQNDIEILKEVKADKVSVEKKCNEMNERIELHKQQNREDLKSLRSDLRHDMDVRFEDLKDFIKANQ